MTASEFRTQLHANLGEFTSAPFLFVGAGVPRRYLGVDDWMSLLRRLAKFTGRDFEYFVASGDDQPASIATTIANALHEPFWSQDQFAPIRERYQGNLRRQDSALKALASAYLSDSIAKLPTTGDLAAEIELLRSVVIDGIITTNFDPLLTTLFPEFKVFVGQEELLFEDVMSVGEIYMIHGSCEQPDSLVLTEDDYARFDDENPVLAAKLMTVFVEHPVVFLGYSLSDSNVAAILRSIVGCLKSPERIARLQNRLIFVEWSPSLTEPTISQISMPVAGTQIPVLAARVPDFVEIFTVLCAVERKFPAKLLRKLKEQVYELVLAKDPKGRLYVQPIDESQDPRDVDVVFGVGAIGQLTAYKGLTRDNLIDDVLADGSGYDPLRIVQEALPAIMSMPGNVPIYKYLRAAKLLDDDGALINPESVDPKIQRRVASRAEKLGVLHSQAAHVTKKLAELKTLAALIADDPADALYVIPGLEDPEQSLDELKAFLVAHNGRDPGETFIHSQWVKVVCLYDWLRYGPAHSTAQRTTTPNRRGTTAANRR